MTGLLIGFNGPPQSGKDSIAKAFRNRVDEWAIHPSHTIALAEPLRHAACVLIGNQLAITDDAEYERLKRIPVLGKMTLRNLMIRLSEDIVKLHGPRDHWAQVAWRTGIQSWLAMNSIVTVTDYGFDAEQLFFQEASELWHFNHLTVHVQREGCSFINDSRNYLYRAGQVTVIHNNDSLDTAVDQVLDGIRHFFGNEYDRPDNQL